MAVRAKCLRTNQTAAEERLWSILRGHRFAGLKFRRQHVIGNYIADFVCTAARLVIEVDGDTHGPDSEAYDAKRTEEFERKGWSVIRFWNSYVLKDRDGGVAETILEALRTSALRQDVKAKLEAQGYFDPALGDSTPLPDPLP